MKRALVIFSVCFFSTSCREKPEPTQPSPPVTEKPVEKGETPDSDSAFIGLTEKEGEALAKDRKLTHRVVKVDGEHRPATRDYRPDRVNFEIEQGRIVRTSRG